MQPLIAPQRCYIPGGLWTPKLGGKITEGDSKRTSHVLEGKVLATNTWKLNTYMIFNRLKSKNLLIIWRYSLKMYQ